MQHALKILVLCFGLFGLYSCETCSAGTGDESTSPLLETPICQFCKDTAKQVNEFAFTDQAKKAIMSAIEQICEHLPFKEQCLTTLTGIYNFLDEEHKKCKPEAVCYMTHLCSQKQHCQLSESVPDCGSCLIGVEKLVKAMEDSSFRKMIARFLKEVCQALPDEKLKQECTKFVEEHLDEWMVRVSKAVNPPAACDVMDMCRMPTKLMLFHGDPATACNTCIDFTTHLKTFMQSPSVTDVLKQILSQLCSITLYYQAACEHVAQPWLDRLITDINKLSEKEFCQKLHIC